MIENERIPQYAVRCLLNGWMDRKQREQYSADPEKDPIHAFVYKYYTKVKKIPPFEIWKLNSSMREKPGR